MIYDAGKLHEPVRISLGEKENILLFSDENGIFGDFKNSVNHYPVSNETKNMLQIIFSRHRLRKAALLTSYHH